MLRIVGIAAADLRGSTKEVVMLGILGLLAAAGLFASAAMADCADNCNNGFDVCMKNCAGQAGCLNTCSTGRSGCLRRCDSSENFTPRRWLLADRCGATTYTCPGTCCYSTSRGYYCADSNGDC
jgi:hypothetical protein